jgi:hypothetical protein
MSDISKFKQVLNKLVAFLDELYQSDMDYQMGKDQLFLALGANPRDSIGLFVDAIVPFASHILEGDEKFFLNYSVPSNTELKTLDIISKVKNCWGQLTGEQRKFLSDQCKLLLILGTIVSKNEKMRLLINTYRDPANPLLF